MDLGFHVAERACITPAGQNHGNVQRDDLNSGGKTTWKRPAGRYVNNNVSPASNALLDPYQDQTRVDLISPKKWDGAATGYAMVLASGIKRALSSHADRRGRPQRRQLVRSDYEPELVLYRPALEGVHVQRACSSGY